MRTIKTVCKIGACEKYCGIEATVEDGVLTCVHFDKQHPITEGYGCIKGRYVPRYQNDPDRLLHPQRRSETGWDQISWDTAADEIGGKLADIRRTYGANAIATYWGNASDSTAILLSMAFGQSFGSPNNFNVLSLEYTDRGAVADRMLGDENFILQPDADNAEFALLLGTNPFATKGMTLLQRRPKVETDLQSIRNRGGKVVVVDPRSTETVKGAATEHVPIRPGTDLFFLFAMIRRIVRTDRCDKKFIAAHVTGFDELCETVESPLLDDAIAWTGIPLQDIERLADEFAVAQGAFATTRVGVQTSHNTTLTEWAVCTLNAITGNVDSPGGVYFNPGAIDMPRLIRTLSKRSNLSPSRIGRYPQIFGGPPASVLADDILSDDPDRIRALVVVAGNPVITFPNTAKVEAALKRLDLLVCIDIYRSDTGAFAHYNLPAATQYEKGVFHFMTANFEARPYAEWRPKVVEPRGEARSEWCIYKALSRAAGVPFLNDRWVDRAMKLAEWCGFNASEEWIYRALLWNKGGLGRLKRAEYGIKYGEMVFGRFLNESLRTRDRKIQLAPREFVEELPNALRATPLPCEQYPFSLISGARRLASFNSWTHNIPELMSKLNGNWATLNREEAASLGIENGSQVCIRTATGEVQIEARLSDDIRPGVVAVHQFWGHHYDSSTRTSRQTPGVNVNLLHSDRQRDRFSGMPVFNGTPCAIERLS